ncbi:hypothetical protein [Frigoribacterium sp. PvP032]|uniref:hypothetical protein n=1 Tax=Frigoribacterium sp. PvP032 TaxID=2806589 RepID=UPI001AE3FAE5|nr:hypothetical protein [Frigoribacterium sp. PvP032]MBP1189476.1 hypothetical protein [Frigoribacterium sp. PvP032]
MSVAVPVLVGLITAAVPEKSTLTKTANSAASLLGLLTLPALGLLPIMRRLFPPPIAEQSEALARVDRDPWHTVVRVVRPAQHARTGTKAFVQLRDGTQFAAWFPGRRVARNQVFAVQGRTGYGEYRHQSVFYVNAVTHQFSFKSWNRARRLR